MSIFRGAMLAVATFASAQSAQAQTPVRWLSQSAAVQAVEAVGVDVAGQVRRAANARDHHQVFGLNSQLARGSLQGAQDTEIPTPGTPIRIDRALISFEW